MPKSLELTGQKFGHLTVISQKKNIKSKTTRWICKCSCGNLVIMDGGMLKYRNKSCGCVHGLKPQEYIKSKVKVDTETGCWIWQGRGRRGKYGQAKWKSDIWMAHRLSYSVFIGPIPKNKLVLHNCPGGDNTLCCNFEHLFLGSNLDNSRDMVEKGRQAKGELNGSAKLKEMDVKEIKRLLILKKSKKEIASQFGLEVTAIYRIEKCHTWAHVVLDT